MAFIGKQPGKAAITSTDITDGIITADKLASDSVTTAKIADNGVTTAKINADAVTDAKIADDVVGTEHLTAGEVDTTALGADAVTAAKIADNAISEEHLDATVVTGLTALAATPADTDEFLVSDAGTLKRIDYSYIKGLSNWSESSGNLLPSNASYGIYLGVNSATAANLLDDYEEGTWTPGCSVSSSDAGGTYVKVGNIVTAKFKISIGASGTNINVTGFPFTATSDGEQQGLAREVETGGDLYFVRMAASNTNGSLIRYDANTSLSTADSFQGQVTYISA